MTASSGPHAFVRPPDPRMGMALGAGHTHQMGGSSGMLPSLLIAEATLRTERCAVPGCGKDRDDPIHWPAE
jgi:hypothetical protein